MDSSRAEFLDPTAPARREILVDIWYPTSSAPNDPRAPYLPNLPALRRVLGDSVMRRRFAPAFAAIEVGRLSTHASEASPPRCPNRGCPVLIFSHGGGVDRSSYTAQYEDLASHGYVVASIAHTYDTHLVVFLDGHVVSYAPQPRDTIPPHPSLPRWRQDLQREARNQSYVRRVISVEAADIGFVLDRLTRFARDSALLSPFFRRLDLDRVGALGHSAGGEAAALACQLDARIKACLNQDGAMHGLPFSRDASGRTMAQPFLYFTRALPRPVDSDSLLVTMEITRAEIDSLIDDVAAGPVRLLSDMPAGAFRVSLATPRVPHMAFSDEPLIHAADDSLATAMALKSLRSVETYTRAFFDKTLLGTKATALDLPTPADSSVLIEKFRPKNAAKGHVSSKPALRLVVDGMRSSSP